MASGLRGLLSGQRTFSCTSLHSHRNVNISARNAEFHAAPDLLDQIDSRRRRRPSVQTVLSPVTPVDHLPAHPHFLPRPVSPTSPDHIFRARTRSCLQHVQQNRRRGLPSAFEAAAMALRLLLGFHFAAFSLFPGPWALAQG